MQFHETTLDNGLKVIAEINPHVHSVALGFFVRTGSRDETESVSGVSHFLEHMAFKGNDKFTAEDVNRVFDEVGAKYNASTSEEVTLFYGAILPEYLPQTFELLAAILQPSVRQEDFDMEKKVILEEIGMYEDMPSFIAYDHVLSTHFAGHPLGQSILGTNESITRLTAQQMRNYHHEHYRAGNIVLAVAGNTQWDVVQKLAQEFCGHWPAGSFDRPLTEAQPTGSTLVLHRSSSQLEHIMQLASSPPARHDLRIAAELLTVIVGDDSGSRLFWELVDPGHADACEVGYNEFDGSGAYMTYLCCDPDQTPFCLEKIEAIYQAVNANGITSEELTRAKNKVASRVVLRGERPMGRLSSLGTNWLYRQEYQSIEQDLETLQNVTAEQIRELLQAYPLGQTSTVAVGPLASLD